MENTTKNSSDLPLHSLEDTRISFKTAQTRIESWLCALKTIFADKDTEAIPRGIYIGPDDLKAIREAHGDGVGIRVYFGLKELEGGGQELSGMVVAVDEEGRHDLVEDKGGELTTIYDFTSPCPNFCAEGSIMLVAVPSECKD
ncbi:hypothetical protein E5K00_02680 [Hymenobacter aquaticus]|uniref:Uncharacterized protein n=1 Tax=Hymenobacter aquaticus TaxID=1867101 RepID=A0A4Z0Q2A5_9BACT|nr:hypothetical protein [Hymenobacter aquaticus]TGE24137.1 hypothetical protein E5K00_02680 [Hymenobacter aquaticus]